MCARTFYRTLAGVKKWHCLHLQPVCARTFSTILAGARKVLCERPSACAQECSNARWLGVNIALFDTLSHGRGPTRVRKNVLLHVCCDSKAHKHPIDYEAFGLIQTPPLVPKSSMRPLQASFRSRGLQGAPTFFSLLFSACAKCSGSHRVPRHVCATLPRFSLALREPMLWGARRLHHVCATFDRLSLAFLERPWVSRRWIIILAAALLLPSSS